MKKIKENTQKYLEIPISWFRNNFILHLEIEQKNSSLILFQLIGRLRFKNKNSAPLSDTSIVALASNTNCSRNVVINSIRIFKKIGLIEVVRVKGISGGFKNRYLINQKTYEKLTDLSLNDLSTWFGRKIKSAKKKITVSKISHTPSEAKKFSGWKLKTRHPETWHSKDFIGYYLFKFKELYGYEDPEFCGIKTDKFSNDMFFRVTVFISALPDKNKIMCREYVDWLFEKVQEPGYWFKDRIMNFEAVFSMKKKYFLKQFLAERTKHKLKNTTLEEYLKQKKEETNE